jgi:hypothetical protein
MLSKFEVFPVDELYLNIVDSAQVSRIGINNGVIADGPIADPRAFVPKTTVRILANLTNIPLILSAEKAYDVPVETAPLLLADGGNGLVRDAVVRARNGHRSLPDHHPLRFRRLTEQDRYNFGLTYSFITGKMGIPAHKFDKDDLDFTVDQQYIDEAPTRHAMSDYFACEHVAEFCAVVMDPRMHIGPGGRFRYSAVSSLLGFGSFELACQLTRKFIELHGDSPLPCDGPSMKTLFQKVTGRTEKGLFVGHPIQMLGARVLHNILTTPMDDLNVNLSGRSTRLARDAELVRQRLHWIINTWLERLYAQNTEVGPWVADKYDSAEFEPKHEEAE